MIKIMREFEFEIELPSTRNQKAIQDKTWHIWVYGDGRRPIDKSSIKVLTFML